MVEAVYIHIPFCEQKCRYCDFLSFGGQSRERQVAYVEALVGEIALRSSGVVPKTIFIGGGTPTCLTVDLLETVLKAVNQYFVTDQLLEYTVEMNPGTVSAEKLELMRKYGVNRLSMGVQSDDGELLALLGRAHDFAQVAASYQMARKAGFENINFDLMYGLPGQNLAGWLATVEHLLALEPEHLSLYQLKVEEHTVFDQWLQSGRIAVFDDEVAFEMYEGAQHLLAQRGYAQYEISNYAQPERASLHNQVYWRTADYLGLGLGAHSFQSPRRFFNTSRWVDYVGPLGDGRLPEVTEEILSPREAMEETIFMGLRMNSGVNLEEFAQRYQVDLLAAFAEAVAICTSKGHLVVEAGYLRLTDQGRVLGNMVFVEFV